MKVTNNTAYATIGCDVQLSENDRIALGIELDKVTNWLETVIGDKAFTEGPYKAINNLTSFISKFAIRASQSNVFTDSPEDFKKAEETTTEVKSDPVEDNVITVDISNSKSLEGLKQILFFSTAANRTRINDFLGLAKESHYSCISFDCTHKPKKAVLDELTHIGYTITSNAVKSLRLDTH